MNMKLLVRLAGYGYSKPWEVLPGLFFGSVEAALHMAAQTAIPLVIGSIVDRALLARDARALLVRALLLVGLAALSTVAKGVYRPGE
jgi:hypothetical protein